MKPTVDGAKVRDARDEALLSRRELSELSGVSQDTIQRVELERGQPYGRTVRRLARALNVDYRSLLRE